MALNNLIKFKKILAVAPSSVHRTQFSQAFNEMGFKNVEIIASVEAAFHMLEVDQYDWVFSPLELTSKVNIFHLLSTIRKTPQLGRVKVSVFTGKDDIMPVGRCFELGALSYHTSNITKENIKIEVEKIVSHLEVFQGDYTLVSAIYIRDFLQNLEHYRDLEAFETAMIRQYLGQPEGLLDLGKAQALNGNEVQGLKTLKQATLLNPDLKERSDTIIEHYIPSDLSTEDESGHPIDMLDIRSCIIIEPDLEVAKRIAVILRNLGVSIIKMFKNPFTAYNYAVKKDCPDLIISEWSLPDFPAPILFQRLTDRLEKDIPVIAINKNFDPSDLPQLQEMGVRTAIKKPFSDKDFFEELVWIIQQERVPNTPESIKRKIKNSIASENHEKTHILLDKFKSHGQVCPGDISCLEAEIAFEEGNFELAKIKAFEAMDSETSSLDVLNILGRSLIQLQEFDAGLRCLESANILSPYNVGRLCSIAEAHLESNNLKKYNESINRAKRISPHSKKVKEVEVKGALRANQTQKAKELMEKLPSLKNVVKSTNNRAIALIQCNRFNEGIKTYKQALQALPPNKVELKSVVLYNLGLAYARAGMLDEALSSLHQALITHDKARRTKIKKLKTKISNAQNHGAKLLLPAVKIASSTDSNERLAKLDKDIVFKMSLDHHERCCYKIFFHYQSTVDLDSYLEGSPKFSLRSSIKKEYTLGLEKEMKAS